MPWQLGALAIAFALIAGALLGISAGLLATLVGARRRVPPDAASGAIGFLAGCFLSSQTHDFAIEVNGVIVGWQPGHQWLGLRPLICEHGILTALIACLSLLALSRVLALYNRPSSS